jgi:hypothetical protein
MSDAPLTWQEIKKDSVTVTASVVASIVATLAFKDMEFSFWSLAIVAFGSLIFCALVLFILNQFMKYSFDEKEHKRSREEKMKTL